MRDLSKYKADDYARIVLKRIWWIIVPAVLLAVAGAITATVLPKQYQANTLILVQAQKISTKYIEPTITSDIRTRIKTIQEEVMSRSRLYEIIDRFKLYPDLRDKMSIDQLIRTMRKSIRVEIRKNDAFAIYHEGSDPETVAQVANAITDQFINANLKLREEQAKETTKFLADMLRDQEEDLKKQEVLLAEFQQAHMGELPQHVDRNLRMIEQLNTQIQLKQDAVRNAQENRLLIEQQIAALKGFADGRLEQSAQEFLRGQLKELEQHLALLKVSRKDSHPAIRTVQGQMANITSLLVSIPAATSEGENKGQLDPMKQTRLTQFEQTLVRNDDYIARLHTEIVEVQDKIATYQERIDNAPKLEASYKDLTRKYLQAQGQYEELLGKNLDAQLAQKLELRQKGEQFIRLDEAVVPTIPFKPDRKKIFAVFCLLGLGLGVGTAVLKEIFDPTFMNAAELEELSKTPVLVTIPVIAESGTPAAMRIIGALGDTHDPMVATSVTEHVVGGTGPLEKISPPFTMEYYGTLKARVEQHFEGKEGSPALVITSPVPTEGKTTTALHFAWIMTMAWKQKVVLVDCDFFRPRVGKYFGIETNVGLYDVLNGELSLEEAMIPVFPNKLSILPAGTDSRQPGELFESDHMKNLIQKLKQDFDYVILDSSALLTNIYEVNVLASLVDGLILVVRAERTPRDVALHALSLINRKQLIGTVLNGVAMSKHRRNAIISSAQFKEKTS